MSLQTKLPINPKGLSLAILFLFMPLIFFAQTLTGLWIGALSNDSNTVRKDHYFEIALTEYRGKVYGYSRSEFIVNDTLYYIVKRVKGTIEGDICEVKDDEIISYNFRGKLDKGIRVTSTFRRNETDSTWHLEGTWKTNATKKYYAVSGKVGLSEEKDLSASKIFPHLEELNLSKDVPFYAERKEETTPALRIVKPERNMSSFAGPGSDELKNNTVSIAVDAPADKQRADADAISSPELAAASVKRPDNNLPKQESKDLGISSTSIKTQAPVNKQRADADEISSPELAAANLKKPVDNPNRQETKNMSASSSAIKTQAPQKTQSNTSIVSQQPDPKAAQPKPSFTKEPENKNTTTAVVTNPAEPVIKPVVAPEKQSVKEFSSNSSRPDITLKAAVVAGRKSEFAQEVIFSSDSLQIAIYDNGVVDGDTVSLYMNGEVIMAKQGLKSSAIKKTIYLTPGKDDEFTLVLYAENLGSYPPNTGLLVVRDGNDVYNLRFSADFQKNAGVVFRRKK